MKRLIIEGEALFSDLKDVYPELSSFDCHVTSRTTFEDFEKNGVATKLFVKEEFINNQETLKVTREIVQWWQGNLKSPLSDYSIGYAARNAFSFRVLGVWLQILAWVDTLLKSFAGEDLYFYGRDEKIQEVVQLVSKAYRIRVYCSGVVKKRKSGFLPNSIKLFIRDFIIRFLFAKINNFVNKNLYSLKYKSIIAFIHTVPELNFFCKLSEEFKKNELLYSVFRTIIGKEKWIQGPFYVFDSFLGFKDLFRLIKFKNFFVKQYFSLAQDAQIKHFSFRGICFWPLIQKEAFHFYRADLPSLVKTIMCGENLLKNLKVKCCFFTTTWNVYEMGFLAVVRKHGLKSIQMMHAYIEGPCNPFSEALSGPEADYHLVWGDYYKRQMEAFCRPTKVIAAGYPFPWDFLNRDDPRGHKYDVLILPSPFSLRHILNFIEIVGRGLSGLGSIRAVIKMHPSEPKRNKAIYLKVLKKYHLNYSILQEGDLKTLMLQSRLIIQSQSTVALETIIHDRPVIDVAILPEEGSVAEWTGDKAVLVAKTPDDLRKHVTDLIIDQNPKLLSALESSRREFWKYHFSFDLNNPKTFQSQIGHVVCDILNDSLH